MTIALYMDHHVPKVITSALRSRGIDVLTAYEDGREEADDLDLIVRATELQRILFTRDHHFFEKTAKLQREGVYFNGVVFAHTLDVPIGRCVNDLEIMAKGGSLEDFVMVKDRLHIY
jgi:hypothetical protein